VVTCSASLTARTLAAITIHGSRSRSQISPGFRFEMSVRSETLPTVRSTTTLFKYEPLSDYLSKQHDYARRAVGEIGNLEDLSAKEAEFRKTYSVAIPTLLRSQARFESMTRQIA
jgi:hypothetical protein